MGFKKLRTDLPVRVPINSLTDHQGVLLEGNGLVNLDPDKVYIERKSGKVVDGSTGTLADLAGGDFVEIVKREYFFKQK